MRYTLLNILALLITSAPALGGALTQDPTVFCPPAAAGGKVDGDLDEIFWQVPPSVPRFVNTSGRTPREQTEAWAAFGKDGVYFAFRCQQAAMSPRNSAAADEIWKDDCVEVLIDADSDRSDYDHFIISAAGARMQERGGGRNGLDRNVRIDWQGAAKMSDGGWTAEVFVPYTSLGRRLSEGEMLRANLCRNNAALGENSCWTTLFGSFHQPLAFGNLVYGVPAEDIRLAVEGPDALETGQQEISVSCTNNTKSAVELTALLYPTGKPIRLDAPWVAGPGKTATTRLAVNFAQPGRVNLRLIAVREKDRVVVAERSFGGDVMTAPPPPVGGVISTGDWGALWACSGTYKVMRGTRPPKDKLKAVNLSAASNEFEPFQLVLRPARRLANVKVTPHTLLGPKGAKIEAWNVKVRNVEYVHVVEPTSSDVRAGMYPDPLPEHTPFSASQGENSPVWITVYVPPRTPAGDYRGTIDVTADGLKKLVVPVVVHVWNFGLPTVSALRTAYGCGFDGPAYYHGAKTLEQNRRLVELYNLDFWRHRVAPCAPYSFYDVRASLDGGQVRVDFADFDVAIQKFFPLFNSYNLPHFGMGDTAGVPMGDQYETLKVDYMRIVAEHLANKGQLAKGYNYIMDEPTEEQYDKVIAEAKLNRLADQRIKVLLTEQVEPKLIGSVDIWVPVLQNYDEKAAKKRQAEGDEVWWYVCCGPHHPYPNNFIDYPAIDHRILHWMAWRVGLNGILYWQTTYWRDNPYDTAMSYTPDGKGKWGNGDGRLLYPPVTKPSETFVDKGPVPSIRWEMIREGIEDFDYFRILRDRVESAAGRPPNAVNKAREALKLVDSCAPSLTQYTKDPAKLDRVRARVAQAIESLGK